jgi:L-fuculose-phosphate aldolase
LGLSWWVTTSIVAAPQIVLLKYDIQTERTKAQMATHTDPQRIIDICKLLHQKNYIAAGDGNISFRQDESRVIITPTGKHKGFIQSADLAMVSINGETIRGFPSSETQMHLAVYRASDDARFVIHAHPPTAIAWSIARPQLKEIPVDAISEVILGIGAIPVVPYARPGTDAMGEAIQPFVRKNRVMILARHGALSWGETLEEAYNGIERLEHSCLILKAAVELGGITPLPAAEVAVLREMRGRLGPQSR